MSSIKIDSSLKFLNIFLKLNEKGVIYLLKVFYKALGPVQTNYYCIEDEEKNCLIIDPGEEGQWIIQDIEGKELKPVAILCTHGHFDHIGAIDAVRDHFKIPVYIHEAEEHTLTDPKLNGSTRYPGLPVVQNKPADHLFQEEGLMTIGPFTFDVKHTPGHSPGSVSFIFKEANFAVVGDTLFSGSIGRTDLPGGNMDILLTSISEKLLTLPDDLTILPGHGPATSPAVEQQQNPFLRHLSK